MNTVTYWQAITNMILAYTCTALHRNWSLPERNLNLLCKEIEAIFGSPFGEQVSHFNPYSLCKCIKDEPLEHEMLLSVEENYSECVTQQKVFLSAGEQGTKTLNDAELHRKYAVCKTVVKC